MMVAIPELDGATGPMVFGGRSGPTAGGDGRARHAAASRARRRCWPRACALVALRRTPARERRSPSCCSTSRPTPAHRHGGLPVGVRIAAQHAAAPAAKATRSRCPKASTRCASASSRATRARYGADANVMRAHPGRRPRAPRAWLAEIEAQWGPAPGPPADRRRSRCSCSARSSATSSSASSRLRLRGRPDAPAVRAGFAPTHAFSPSTAICARTSAPTPCCTSARTARWSSCPASRRAVGDECWPDRLIGDLPNFYLYAANNPSEGTRQAPRGATLISYLTPPVAHGRALPRACST
jgi:magnesium chelatase subunit H